MPTNDCDRRDGPDPLAPLAAPLFSPSKYASDVPADENTRFALGVLRNDIRTHLATALTTILEHAPAKNRFSDEALRFFIEVIEEKYRIKIGFGTAKRMAREELANGDWLKMRKIDFKDTWQVLSGAEFKSAWRKDLNEHDAAERLISSQALKRQSTATQHATMSKPNVRRKRPRALHDSDDMNESKSPKSADIISAAAILASSGLRTRKAIRYCESVRLSDGEEVMDEGSMLSPSTTFHRRIAPTLVSLSSAIAKSQVKRPIRWRPNPLILQAPRILDVADLLDPNDATADAAHTDPLASRKFRSTLMIQRSMCHQFAAQDDKEYPDGEFIPRCVHCITKQKDSCRFNGLRAIDTHGNAKLVGYSSSLLLPTPLAADTSRRVLKSVADACLVKYAAPAWAFGGDMPDLLAINMWIRSTMAASLSIVLGREVEHAFGDIHGLEIGARGAQSMPELRAALRVPSVGRFRVSRMPDGSIVEIGPKVKSSEVPGRIETIMRTTRALCDICSTTIANGYWIAQCCGLEMCLTCMEEWASAVDSSGPCDNIDVLSRHAELIPLRAYVPRTDINARKRCSYQNEHVITSFLRAGCGGIAPWTLLKVYEQVRATPPQAQAPLEHVQQLLPPIVDVDSAPMRPVAQISSGTEIANNFRCRMDRAEPFMVTGIVPDPSLWSPECFIERYGPNPIEILDCRRNHEPLRGSFKVQDFFRGFMDASARINGPDSILKLKDWPDKTEFHHAFPDHFKSFVAMLPFKYFCAADGPGNMASRIPANIVPLDLGPKMYNAYGSGDDEENAPGTTCLHMDMADAINIMMYAIDAKTGVVVENSQRPANFPAAALWYIFRPEDAGEIRQFIRSQFPSLDIDDPIHDQAFYLTAPLRKRLYEQHGVAGTMVLQNPGDAVFIPAGCPHQVCNYVSCIKVAMDYVYPRNVSRCLELTGQFRMLGPRHRRREDLLGIKQIMWHSWVSTMSLDERLDAVEAITSALHTVPKNGKATKVDADDSVLSVRILKRKRTVQPI